MKFVTVIRLPFLIPALFALNAQAANIPAGQPYTATLGNFTCTPTAALTVDENKTADGMMLRLTEGNMQTDINVHQFKAKVQGELNLRIYRAEFLESFLSATILPGVKKTAPKSSILNKQKMVLDGHTVLASAINLPASSKQGTDNVLVQIQDMNADFMYTLSKTMPASKDKNKEQFLKDAYADLATAYHMCKFPE